MAIHSNNIIPVDADLEKNIENDILVEIYRAGKIPNWRLIRNSLKSILKKPVAHFSNLIATLDTIIANEGFVATAQYALPELTHPATALGQDKIPASGPLVVASNHPGTYDAFAIISQMPRDDIKLIVSDVPFFRNLPHANQHFILATHNTNQRTNVIRQSIRHLQEGGTLLIFPSGRIDPDPSILAGAEDGLQRWSRSIEVFLKKVPEAKLLLTITSGVLSGDFVNHFIPRMFNNDHERRRVMEFMQVIRQMVQLKPLELNPRVSFGTPLSVEDVLADIETGDDMLVKQKAQQLLDFHMDQFYPGKTAESYLTL